MNFGISRAEAAELPEAGGEDDERFGDGRARIMDSWFEDESGARCFDGVADCQVTADRRSGDIERHPAHERRRGERRSSSPEASRGLGVLVYSRR